MSATERRQARKLTPRRERFVLAYCETLNATAAAKRAGYSARNARFQGARLLANVGVATAVNEVLGESLRKAWLEVERLDQNVAEIAFADIRRLFDANGQFLPMDLWPDDIARAIAAIDAVTTRSGKQVLAIRKIRLADKIAALTLGMKRLGMLRENIKLSGSLDLEQLVLRSMQPKPRTEAQPK